MPHAIVWLCPPSNAAPHRLWRRQSLPAGGVVGCCHTLVVVSSVAGVGVLASAMVTCLNAQLTAALQHWTTAATRLGCRPPLYRARSQNFESVMGFLQGFGAYHPVDWLN